MVERLALEGQLDKLASLIRGGYDRAQARDMLGVSDEKLDDFLDMLAQRQPVGKPKRHKPPVNRMSAKTLDTKRICTKCGRQYTRRKGGTKKLCEICYERLPDNSKSVAAVPTAFESNRRRH